MHRRELGKSHRLIHRREALKVAALTGSSLWLGAGLYGCADSNDEDFEAGVQTDDLNDGGVPLFAGGLTTSLLEERRYQAAVRGRLPRELRGTLYKNGPGLFDRAGVRRRTLLDGDGLITAYRFADGRVEFQNRFVRTPKFEAEQAAGRFLVDSWTTPLDEQGTVEDDTQSGVTVWPWGERLYAFDENSACWELSPNDLETVGKATFGLGEDEAAFFAHGKQLAGSAEFSLFGVRYGKLQYNYAVLDPEQRSRVARSFPVTDYGPPSYMHDWFVTPRFFVLHLMPAILDGEAIGGGSVLRDAIDWQPALPSRLLVFRRDDLEARPQVFEMDPAWMWHSVNAFERSDSELVLDWIGYDDPHHFVGAGAEWELIMQGELVRTGAPGVLRRSVLDLSAGRLSTERYEDLDDQEFPVVAPDRVGQAYRYTYLVHDPGAGVLYQSVAKIDLESGRHQTFDFGAGRIALEPTFVPRPGGRSEDDGWLLVEVANANTGRASLCVFDARAIEDGPIARVMLEHHVPMRFHGRWAPG